MLLLEITGFLVWIYILATWIIGIPILWKELNEKYSCRHYIAGHYEEFGYDKTRHKGGSCELWRQMTRKQWVLAIGTYPLYIPFSLPKKYM